MPRAITENGVTVGFNFDKDGKARWYGHVDNGDGTYTSLSVGEAKAACVSTMAGAARDLGEEDLARQIESEQGVQRN